MVMGISIAIVIIVVCAGWVVWQRRRGKAAIAPVSTEVTSPNNLAHKAFVRGNSYLFNGEVDEAIAAFQQALELDPSHSHAANRLAEAERRQAAQANETNPTAA